MVFNKFRNANVHLLALIFHTIYCTEKWHTCCEAGPQSRESHGFPEIVWLPKAKRFPALEFTSHDLSCLNSWC
jgi:hypothetical protein